MSSYGKNNRADQGIGHPGRSGIDRTVWSSPSG